MNSLYDDNHRKLQDEFKTRNLADAVENIILRPEFTEEDKAFIESRDMLFLSTLDAMGRPSVSYKGGGKGFIKVVDKNTLAFPSYDGNGMFLSMGNISSNGKVGLLFIDFENPHRLRIYGDANVSADDELMSEFHESQLVVRVKITELWQNCPRYIHKHQKIETSQYVPQIDEETPMPAWKKVDLLQEVLPPSDHGKAEKQGGTLSIHQLMEMEKRYD